MFQMELIAVFGVSGKLGVRRVLVALGLVRAFSFLKPK